MFSPGSLSADSRNQSTSGFPCLSEKYTWFLWNVWCTCVLWCVLKVASLVVCAECVGMWVCTRECARESKNLVLLNSKRVCVQSSERLFYLFYFQHPCFICFIILCLVKSVLFLFYSGIFCFILGKIWNSCNIYHILIWCGDKTFPKKA